MQTSPNTLASESNEHFSAGNHILGFRRFLDICLETETDPDEKVEILNLCKSFNASSLNNAVRLNDSEVEHILKLEETIVQRNARISSSIKEIMISNGIAKSYSSGHFRLKPIDINISTGELVGIVGENGNGKTTLLRMLASDLSKDEGSIEYVNEHDETLYDLKRGIAYIPQRIPRWHGKLKNNLHFAAASRGVYGFENEFVVEVMLARLGLAKYSELYWTQISSGYRTRFELARILLLTPSLLILDEPLANLDINAQQTFLQDIRNLAKSIKNPLAIIFSSQQLHEVEKVADHIVFLRNGESVYNSTMDSNDILVKNTEIEIETVENRERLLELLNDIEGLTIVNQGGLFIIRCSKEVHSDVVLKKLVTSDVQMTYFRDLTNSTKKFFNE